jgi:hypothetical protein
MTRLEGLTIREQDLVAGAKQERAAADWGRGFLRGVASGVMMTLLVLWRWLG